MFKLNDVVVRKNSKSEVFRVLSYDPDSDWVWLACVEQGPNYTPVTEPACRFKLQEIRPGNIVSWFNGKVRYEVIAIDPTEKFVWAKCIGEKFVIEAQGFTTLKFSECVRVNE